MTNLPGALEPDRAEPPAIADPPRTWANRTTFGVAGASFFSDVSHELATAVLPAFLLTLGAGPAALGWIEGMADGLSAVAKIGGGVATDRAERRKPLASIGYLVTAVGIALISVCTTWTGVLACRIAAWIGRGSRSAPRDVLLSDAAPAAAQGRAFGVERASDAAGAVCGPLIAWWLLGSGRRPEEIVLWSIWPGLAAFLMIVFVVREPARRTAGRERFGFRKSLRVAGAPFRRVLGAVFLFGCGDFSRTLLIFFAMQRLPKSDGMLEAGFAAIALYALHNAVSSLAALPIGVAADRFGRGATLRLGYAAAVATTLGFAFAPPGLLSYALLFAASGVYIACEEVAEKALAAELLPAEVKGAGLGTLAAVNGLGDLVSSALVGTLWSLFPGREWIGLVSAAALQLGGMLLLPRR